MLATYIPDKLTPLVVAEAMRALRSAYETVEGVTPAAETLAIHTAQSALEAARWKSLHNFCFTNAKGSSTYTGSYQCYKCNEQLKGPDGELHWVYFVPEGELVGGFGTALKGAPLPVPDGHPQTRFRAFHDVESGAIDHMRLVKSKWPEAWAAARGRDVAGFVHGLKMRGFFTADEAPYLKGVASMMREFLPLALNLNATPLPPPDDDHEMRAAALATLAPDPDRWIDRFLVEANDRLYTSVQDDLNRGAGHAQREFEADDDSTSEPNA